MACYDLILGREGNTDYGSSLIYPSLHLQPLGFYYSKVFARVDQDKFCFLLLSHGSASTSRDIWEGSSFKILVTRIRLYWWSLGGPFWQSHIVPRASILINKYNCKVHWLEGNCVSRNSFTWKGIVKCGEVMRQGVCSLVGHG